MEMIIPTCYDDLKRCWRRRKYKRLNNFGQAYNYNTNKRKLKVARLGGGGSRASLAWNNNNTEIMASNLSSAIVSPLKFLARFHDAYVAMMMRLAMNVEKLNDKGLLVKGRRKKKKVAGDIGDVTKVSLGEEVQDRLVLEVYKRLVTSADVGNI